MPRFLKQLIIFFIFIFIIGSVVYFFFIKESPEPTPSPTPEAELIEPPQIISQHLLKVGNLDYDFLVQIKNPNTDFGATDVFYELKLFGQDNELLGIRNGSINLLPGQTRYEIISPLKTDREVANTSFKITNANWQKLKEFIPQSLFLVKNEEYLKTPLEPGFSKLRATLHNNSNFDFDRVDIHIVLFDGNGKPIAVNKTDVRTFLSGTDRFFEVKWLEQFSGEVNRAEIDAYTDVFKNSNFIKEHGTQEEFQKFY